MNKGLKALKDLRNCLQAYYTMENVPNIDSNLDTIETELKRLEQIETNQAIFENNPITVSKKIMAFEIVKKNFDFEFDDETLTISVPYDLIFFNDTIKEYELLKEVLL